MSGHGPEPRSRQYHQGATRARKRLGVRRANLGTSAATVQTREGYRCNPLGCKGIPNWAASVRPRNLGGLACEVYPAQTDHGSVGGYQLFGYAMRVPELAVMARRERDGVPPIGGVHIVSAELNKDHDVVRQRRIRADDQRTQRRAVRCGVAVNQFEVIAKPPVAVRD